MPVATSATTNTTPSLCNEALMLAPPMCPPVNGINNPYRLAVLGRLECLQRTLSRFDRIGNPAEGFACGITSAFRRDGAAPWPTLRRVPGERSTDAAVSTTQQTSFLLYGYPPRRR
jgi:hypothetical protein